MLPTFVIGLREGLEASLIVGIVAAFLGQENRRDALKPMWTGVAIAVAISAAVGIGLDLANQALPQRQQEGLETIIGAVAVCVVTFMIVWMRRHARGLKGELQNAAGGALASGSTWALVGMAFFAVIREGFETAVFLLAAFDASGNATAAGFGAALGIVVAMGLGYGIYKGGVHINLQKFFKVTATVLVLVAAGLVAMAFHTAHEAGWINSMQGEALDLRWLVKPGSVTASLLTGMLGLQPRPTNIEVVAYLAFAVPMLMFVLLPDRLRPGFRAFGRRSVAGATIATLALVLVACGDNSLPGGSKIAGARNVSVTINDSGCEPNSLTVPSGPTNFTVKASGSGKVTEFEILQGSRIIGERENIAPGLSATFSLDLAPGKYVLYCPNGSKEKGVLTVVAAATPVANARSAELRAAVTGYGEYVRARTDVLVQRTTEFVAAVKAGDVAKSKKLFPTARAPYEEIEPVAESFGGLDPKIDARVNDVEPGAAWTGFHRIEQALWKHNTTAGMSKIADGLLADVRDLQRKVATATYQPAQLANGATELLGEVSKSKITGEEDRYSHTDLWDFEANVIGAQKAYELLKPALLKRNAALAAQIDKRFTASDEALASHRVGGGFKFYDQLDKASIRLLSQRIDALAEPLSKVAAAVVTR